MLHALESIPRAVVGCTWTWLFSRIGMGMLFFAAGFWKLRKHDWAAGLLGRGEPGRERRWRLVSLGLPAAELALGTALLLGILTHAAAGGAAFLLAIFTGFALDAALRGRRVQVSCAPGLSCSTGGAMVVRNLALGFLALGLARWGGDALCADGWLLGWRLPSLRADDALPALTVVAAVLVIGHLAGPLQAMAGQHRKLGARAA